MGKEKLLILACCGPDLTFPLEFLNTKYEIYVYFYNPNIHPVMEYNRRLFDAMMVTEIYDSIWIKPEYEYKRWFEYVKGYEKEKEGGKRCELCFRIRIIKACSKAKELGINKITTTLTISPHKDALLIKKLGEEICDGDVKYIHCDFKKNGGFKKSVELSKKYGLYRQKFCGCIFSLLESKKRIRRKNRNFKIW